MNTLKWAVFCFSVTVMYSSVWRSEENACIVTESLYFYYFKENLGFWVCNMRVDAISYIKKIVLKPGYDYFHRNFGIDGQTENNFSLYINVYVKTL